MRTDVIVLFEPPVDDGLRLLEVWARKTYSHKEELSALLSHSRDFPKQVKDKAKDISKDTKEWVKSGFDDE